MRYPTSSTGSIYYYQICFIPRAHFSRNEPFWQSSVLFSWIYYTTLISPLSFCNLNCICFSASFFFFFLLLLFWLLSLTLEAFGGWILLIGGFHCTSPISQPSFLLGDPLKLESGDLSGTIQRIKRRILSSPAGLGGRVEWGKGGSLKHGYWCSRNGKGEGNGLRGSSSVCNALLCPPLCFSPPPD